jgi:hypothetical protein
MIQPSKNSPAQISFNITEDSSQLHLALIFKDERDAISSYYEFKFFKHVKMSMNKVANSPNFNFEFEEEGGKMIILPNVIRDVKTFSEIQDELNLVTSARLSFYKVRGDGKPELISVSSLGSSTFQLISDIQSFETSVK